MLEDNAPLPLPFPLSKEAPFANTTPEQMDYVLVNAVGFGGNAVSILLSK
jgi:3-oxoacyl-(acyl-carrier-protein) synthase